MSLQKLRLRTPAKINLFLGVSTQLDERNYHRVDSIMAAVDLCDEVSIEPSEQLCVSCDRPGLCPVEQNTAYKAACAMGKAYERTPNVHICLHKNIPAKSGLGGGSSDAAAVMLGLCELWGIDAHDKKLDAIAASLGADVPFFLHESPAYYDGAGDIFHASYELPHEGSCVLIMPQDNGISAAEAYRAFDQNPQELPSVACMQQAIASRDLATIAKHVANNLDPIATQLIPSIQIIKAWLSSQKNVLCSLVTGSGSCTYALCDDAYAAQEIACSASAKGWFAYTAKFCAARPWFLNV